MTLTQRLIDYYLPTKDSSCNNLMSKSLRVKESTLHESKGSLNSPNGRLSLDEKAHTVILGGFKFTLKHPQVAKTQKKSQIPVSKSEKHKIDKKLISRVIDRWTSTISDVQDINIETLQTNLKQESIDILESSSELLSSPTVVRWRSLIIRAVEHMESTSYQYGLSPNEYDLQKYYIRALEFLGDVIGLYSHLMSDSSISDEEDETYYSRLVDVMDYLENDFDDYVGDNIPMNSEAPGVF